VSSLPGKVAIVTGASRGIGRAIAVRLARDGVSVLLTARDEAALDGAVQEIQAAGGTAAWIAVDLRLRDSAQRLVDDVLGSLDASISWSITRVRPSGASFLALTDDDWADGFALKFFGAMRLTRYAWPHLKAQAGSVVHISGIGGRTPGREFAIGGSVNAALLSFTKALAELGIADGVQVNAHQPRRGADRPSAGTSRRDRLQSDARGTKVYPGLRYHARRRTRGYR